MSVGNNVCIVMIKQIIAHCCSKVRISCRQNMEYIFIITEQGVVVINLDVVKQKESESEVEWKKREGMKDVVIASFLHLGETGATMKLNEKQEFKYLTLGYKDFHWNKDNVNI